MAKSSHELAGIEVFWVVGAVHFLQPRHTLCLVGIDGVVQSGCPESSAFVGGIAAVIMGHMARGRIRLTRPNGDGWR